MNKEIKINVPDGFCIDESRSDLKTGVIFFKEVEVNSEKGYPKSWEELGGIDGYFVCSGEDASEVPGICQVIDVFPDATTRDVAPTREYCEAWIALCQLLQLRERYIEIAEPGWVPDFTKSTPKYCIDVSNNTLRLCMYGTAYHVLYFPTEECARLFMKNFPDLLEVAKPLL